MKATRLSLTTFAVEAESLSCDRPGCGFVTRALRYRVGDPCRRCEVNGRQPPGRLERSTYQVDLMTYERNGGCGCWHFEKRLGPKLAAMSPADQRLFRRRCKHIKAARAAAKEDDNFDELLAALPNQEEQT